MEGTQFRCAEGGAPAPAPAPAPLDGPAPAFTSSLPTGLVTDSVAAPTVSFGDGTTLTVSALTTPAGGVPFSNGTEPGVLTEVGTGTGTQVGTKATASALSTSSSIHAATSMATKNVIALGSAILFAVAAWAVVGRG